MCSKFNEPPDEGNPETPEPEGEGNHTGNLMDSDVNVLTDLLKERLEEAFHNYTPGSGYPLSLIAEIVCSSEPIDLAYAAGRLPIEERLVIFDLLSSFDDKIDFISNTDRNTRVAIFRHMDEAKVTLLMSKMSADNAAFVLQDVRSERQLKRIIEGVKLVDAQLASEILEIMHHRPNTAARIMTSEFFAFHKERTIGEVMTEIRKNSFIELTQVVFVINDKGEVKGCVPARTLIINAGAPGLQLRQVMRQIEHQVHSDSSREEVIDLVERYRLSELPVVDDEGVLIGVVTSSGVIDAMEDIADQTIGQIAGTAEKVGELETISKKILLRFPWLLVTLLAGILNGGVISSFQNHFGSVLTFVLFFVPLITGLSGNIGIQCSSVLVRGMATGMLSSGGRMEAVVKELQIGVIEGLIFGGMSFGLVYFLESYHIIALPVSSLIVGVIVGVGLFGACITGALLGVLSPLFFARIGVDPAVSSGPIITAFSDFLSMVIYFLIALGIGLFLI